MKDKAFYRRIDRAVASADIPRILEQISIPYKKRFPNLWFRCISPNHRKDKVPSTKITVDPDSSYFGVWHCFGCHTSGNIISLVQLTWDISFSEALVLVEHFQTDRKYEKKEPEHKPAILPKYYESPNIPDEWDQKYLEYLKKRKLSWAQIQKYKIGYVDAGRYIDRVIAPVTLGKEFKTFIARSILKDAEVKVLAADNGAVGLFGSQFCDPKNGPIVIFEGWFDKFHAERVGFMNTVSAQTNRIHPEQFEFIKKYPYGIVVPDNDDAGNYFVDSLAPYIEDFPFLIGRIHNGKDPDDTDDEDLIRAIENPEEWKPSSSTTIEVVL